MSRPIACCPVVYDLIATDTYILCHWSAI